MEESVEMIDRLASATGDPIHAALNAASRARSARDGEQSSPAAALASNAAAHLLAANYRPHTARTLTLLGQLLAPHDRAQAIRHLESAINLHLATGAAWRLERCFSQLRKLGHEGRRVVAQTRGPASLTKREREVIELARQGRTTSEIGRLLFISARTVETHLANSYAKLGTRSRLELIRRASDLNRTSAG